MRRLLLAAALTVTAAPAFAQAPSTPEQDLRCEAVVSLLAPTIGDGEKKAGVAAGLAYFIGRWEVATGRRFEEALTTDFLLDTSANMQTYNKECGTRLMSLGQRMQEWGKALQASVKNPE